VLVMRTKALKPTAVPVSVAARMGLDVIVSKRLSKPYWSGRSGHWLKVKNPDSPAMVRHREGRLLHYWPASSARDLPARASPKVR
jgi:hypothetical protein